MQNATLYRLAGLSLLLGGLVAVVAHLIHPATPEGPEGVAAFLEATPSAHLVLFTGVLLLLLGLPGLYARHRRDGGPLAFGGFVLLFAGVALGDFIHCPVEFGPVAALQGLPIEQAGRVWMRTYRETPLAVLVTISPAALFAGALLFLIGTRGTAGFPHWPRLLLWVFPCLLVASFLPVVSPYAAEAFAPVFYLAFAGYGGALLAERGAGEKGAAPPAAAKAEEGRDDPGVRTTAGRP